MKKDSVKKIEFALDLEKEMVGVKFMIIRKSLIN